MSGKYKEASIGFTDCLELGKIYNPEFRIKSLEQLREIFHVSSMNYLFPKIKMNLFYLKNLFYKVKNIFERNILK